MINEPNFYSETLRRQTLPLVEAMFPGYSRLLDEHWDEVLALFCAWDVVRFHNFIFPGTPTGNMLMRSLRP